MLDGQHPWRQSRLTEEEMDRDARMEEMQEHAVGIVGEEDVMRCV